MKEKLIDEVLQVFSELALKLGMELVQSETSPLYETVIYSGSRKALVISEDIREGYISVRAGTRLDSFVSADSSTHKYAVEEPVSVEMLMVQDSVYNEIPNGYYTLMKPGKRKEALQKFAQYISNNLDKVFILQEMP